MVSAQLADAPAADLASLKYYTVKRGDTLPLIARKLHVSKADLAEANYLAAAARVAAGQKLMVPNEAAVLMAARTDRPVPADRGALDGRARRPARRAGRELQPRQGQLRREARRHARLDRPALPDDGRVDQDLESAAAGRRISPPASA